MNIKNNFLSIIIVFSFSYIYCDQTVDFNLEKKIIINGKSYFKILPLDFKEINQEIMTQPFSLYVGHKVPNENLVYIIENKDEMKKLCLELYGISLFKKNNSFRFKYLQTIFHQSFLNNELIHIVRFKNAKQYFLNFKQFTEFKNDFVDLLLVQQHFNSLEKTI